MCSAMRGWRKPTTSTFRTSVAIISLLLSTGCAKQPRLRELPAQPPPVTVQEFTGPREGWPPQPRGRTNVTSVPSTRIAGALTAELEGEIRASALHDARVRAALGERFGYVDTSESEPPKTAQGRAAQLATRVTFYSYTNNVAVEVDMRGRAVEAVRPRANYQPPEGAEEIKAAVDLARGNPRLARTVRDLTANAIVTFPAAGQPGHGHRVLYVAFSATGEEITRYYATVDLTAGKILASGPAATAKGR